MLGINKTLKAIAIALVIAIVTELVPLGIFAQENTANLSSLEQHEPGSAPEEEQEEQNKPSEIAYEDEEKRTESTKTYRTTNGHYITAEYEIPIHYKDDKNQYQNIDNTLQKEGETLTAIAGRSKITLEQNITSTKKVKLSKTEEEHTQTPRIVSYTKEDFEIVWGYEGITNTKAEKEEPQKEETLTGNDKNTTLTKLSDKIIYKNIYPSVDLEIISTTTGIKENIILKNKTAQKEFIQQASTNYIAKQTDEKSIGLYKDRNTKEPEYTITAPNMTDAAGEISSNIRLELTQTGSNITIKIKPDTKWLNDSKRIYPIYIDPVLSTQYVLSFQDTFISELKDNPAANNSEYAIRYGRNSSYGTCIGLVKPNIELIETVKNVVIIKATISFTQRPYNYTPAGTTGETHIHKITAGWNETTVGWAFRTNIETAIQDTAPTTTADNYEQMHFDITRLVREWYDGATNNGIAITMPTTGGDKSNAYYSKEGTGGGNDIVKPRLKIEYRINTGLEEYWTYQNHTTGAATAHINDYNGNLVYTVPMTASSFGKMPINVTAVYNSANASSIPADITPSSHPLNMGKGWRLNIHEIMKDTALNGYRYIYTDGDGTEHYLINTGTGNYIDEDGLGITYNGSMITYPDGSKTYFKFHSSPTSKYAYKWENKDGDWIELKNLSVCGTYLENSSGYYAFIGTSTPTSGAVQYITEPTTTNPLIGTNYATDPRNINQTIRAIHVNYDNAGQNTVCGYSHQTGPSSTNRIPLLSIVNGPKGIINIHDADNIGYAYEYSTANHVNRIAKITEKNTNGTTGQIITIQHGQNSTTYTDITSGTPSITYQFDNYGRTTEVHDAKGNAAMYDYYKTNANSDNKKNKITETGNTTASTANYLSNGSFERGTESWSWRAFDTRLTNSPNIEYAHWSHIGLNNSSGFDFHYNLAINSRCGIGQEIILPVGIYTLSGHVKVNQITTTTGDSGACAAAILYNSNNQIIGTYNSEIIKETTDYIRVSVSFTVTSGTAKVLVMGSIINATGATMWDEFQLEKEETANKINLVENANIENPSNTRWTLGTGASYYSDNSTPPNSTAYNRMIKIVGDNANRSAYQSITLNDPGETGYTISGWSKAMSLPYTAGTNRSWGIKGTIFYSDGTWDLYAKTYDYNPAVTNWQYLSFHIQGVPLGNRRISTIQITLIYNNQKNTAYFDNLQIIRNTAQKYEYDSKGNLVSTGNEKGTEGQITYNGIYAVGATSKTEAIDQYLNIRKNAVFAKTSTGSRTDYTYDAHDNITSTTLRKDALSSAITPGKWYYLRNALTGKNLTYDHNIGNTAPLVQVSRGNTANQQWRIEATGDGYYRLVSKHNENLAINITGGVNNDNIGLQVLTKGGQDSQKFKIETTGYGSYKITSKISGDTKTISIPMGNPGENIQAIMFHYQGDSYFEQLYYIEEAEQTNQEEIGRAHV